MKWKPLTIITKHSPLDVAAVLDPPLACLNNFARLKGSVRLDHDLIAKIYLPR